MAKVTIPLTGGLNFLPDRRRVTPGQMVSCLNYEVTKTGDVRRILGYRQFSGGCFNGPVTEYVLGTQPGSNYAGGYTYFEWGQPGGIYTDDGALDTVSGRARNPWSSDAADGSTTFTFLSGRRGRRAIAPEAITLQPGAGAMASTSSVSAVVSSALLPRGVALGWGIYDYHNILSEKFLASRSEPTIGLTTGWTCDAENVPSVDTFGKTLGGALFRDRLVVAADLQCFRFQNCNEAPSVGDVLEFIESGNAIGRCYVERVIFEQGSSSTGDGFGRLWVSGGVPGASGGPGVFPATDFTYSSGYVITSANQVDNITTGTTNVMSVHRYLDPEAAALWRSTSIFDTASASYTPAWERVDCGYEVGFGTGGNQFVVVNRIAREEDLLELAAPVTTDWAVPGALTVGGTPGTASTVQTDDGTVYNFSTLTGGLVPHPVFVVSDFGLDIPDYATIIGVEVEANIFDGASVSPGPQFISVSLQVGSTTYGNLAPAGVIPTAAATTYTFGSATNLWGASLSPADARGSDFGVAITFTAQDARVDYVRIRVTYKPYEARVYFYDPSTPTLTVSSLVRSGSTVTATTAVAHKMATGQTATIAGAVETQYNGTWTITVTGTTTFTYQITTTPSTPATGSITAKLADVSTADSVWYYKRKGFFADTDAEGVLTIYNVSHPTYIKSGQRIRSAAADAGTLYASTTSGVDRVFMPSSKDVERNNSRYTWAQGNFYADENYKQLFCANGAGPAISYDGKYVIRIRPSLTEKDNKPRHVAVFGSQLALGFAFGDLFLSDDGEPESFAGVVNGNSPPAHTADFSPAVEQIPFADRIHGLLRLPQQSLAVFCDKSIQRVTGSPGAFATQVVRDGDGCVEYTAKNLNGIICYTDVRGIGMLRASDLFGEVIPQYVSFSVGPWLNPRINRNDSLPQAGVVACEVVPNKDQYRLFFEDGKVLTMTLVGNGLDPMFSIQDYSQPVSWVCTGIYGDDLHQQFFAFARGVETASVFQMDVGTTFNGAGFGSRVEFYLGDMGPDYAGQSKRFASIGVDGSAYGYAPLATAYRVSGIPRDASAVSSGQYIPLSLGNATGEDYLARNFYRGTCDVSGKGDTLIVQFETDGNTDYVLGTQPTGFSYLMPHELTSITVYFDPERVESPMR